MKAVLKNWFLILYIGVFVLFLVVVPCFSFCFTFFESMTKEENYYDEVEYVAPADGFVIDSYDIEMTVTDNNVVDVTETIVTDWYESWHHGIYRTIPQWLRYTDKDGNTIRRFSKVSHLKANENYSVSTVEKKKKIKIGKSYETVGEGPHTYKISYKYDMGKDPYKGFDEFIFHAFGDYWGTEINNATIKINMPKNIEGMKVNFFGDKYRKDNLNEYVEYTIDGKTILIEYTGDKLDIPLEKSLTVDIELPEGYFVGGNYNYGRASLNSIIIAIGITIILAMFWYKHGKDFKDRSETIEFYPPDNLSSAEIGYIYNKNTHEKLALSLIISLASKGYLKIDDDKEKGIVLTSLVGLPPSYKMVNLKKPTRVVTVFILKDINEDELTYQEKLMMKFLSREGNKEKSFRSNLKSFDKVKNSLIDKGYISIKSDEIEDPDKASREENERRRLAIEEFEKKLKVMPDMSGDERYVFDCIFKDEEVSVLKKNKTIYKIFDRTVDSVKSNLKDKIVDSTAERYRVYSILLTLVTCALWPIAFLIFEDLDPAIRFMYYAFPICILIQIFFIIIMGRKTHYGEEIESRVKGFRNFLLTVEKDKLEALVEENPSYFYNILPYTYVLGISSKWVSKFEDIEYPEMDTGSFALYDTSNSYSFCNSISYPKTSSGSGSSSSSSSCGGGCSSCGGGCSSCGGGGSW